METGGSLPCSQKPSTGPILNHMDLLHSSHILKSQVWQS